MSGNLILVGGGGHCKSVISALPRKMYDNIIIVDRSELVGTEVNGIPFAGTDDDLSSYFDKGYTNAFITVGSVHSSPKREILSQRLKDIGFSFPCIIDSSAVIADNVSIGEGTFVGKNVVLNSGSAVGRFCIVNTGTIVDHDCKISDFVHLSPGVVLSGAVSVGKNTHIGTASCLKQCITVGSETTIGMGSVVLHDIPDRCVAFGNPCRVREVV